MSLNPFNVKAGLSVGNSPTINVIAANGDANLANLTVNNDANVTGNLNMTGNINAQVFQDGTSSITQSQAVGITTITTNGNSTQFLPSGQINLSGSSTIGGGTYAGSQLELASSQTNLKQLRDGNVTVQVGNAGATTSTWTFGNNGNLSAPGGITATGNITGGNLTTLGTANVATLAVTGNANIVGMTSLGAVANVRITGGSNGYVLTTDSTGNLSWTSQSIKYSREIHVDPTLGNDTTGDGSYNKPYATVMKAHSMISSGFTVYLHVGAYTENVTWTKPNCDIVGLSAGGMVNTSGTWTVGVQTGSSVRIKDVSFGGAFTQNGLGRIIFQSCYLRSTFSKTSGEYTQFDDTDAAGTGISITSAGTVVFNGSSQNVIVVNNASAVVSIMNTIATASITVLAGTVVTADSYIYALTNTGNAVTSSAGTAVYMYNSHCIAPNNTIARVSLAGFWTSNDTQYDKANSTLTGTNLGTVSHFDAINIQGALTVGATVAATGNVSGANMSATGFVKTAVKTVATLTAAATAGAGARSFVSDANTTTFGDIVGGAGSNSMPVWCNGTSWLVG